MSAPTDPGSTPQASRIRPVDPDIVNHDTDLLTAMSDPTRYTLLRLLNRANATVCVCDLEAAVPVGQSAVSQALARLHDAGLVTREKHGTWRYYGLTPLARTLLETIDTIRHP